MDHPSELGLLPITSLKGMFRKRYSVPDSRWAVIWKPPGSGRVEVKKPGEVLSVRFWERLLGLDTRWQFALIPHRIPRDPITQWKFYTRSYDQQWLIVPVELQLSVKDAKDAERFFKQVIIPLQSASFEKLVNRIMPPEERLEELGERWKADDLIRETAAQERFSKDFSKKFREVLEKRCEDLGLTLRVLQIGKPSLGPDFADLQERRQKIDQAIEDRSLEKPNEEIDPDKLGLKPQDQLLLETFLYGLKKRFPRETESYFSKSVLQAVDQYGQGLKGDTSIRPGVSDTRGRQVLSIVRTLLPLGQIGVSLGLILILNDLTDLLQEASSILFGLLTWLVQVFTLLGLEDWHWQRISHRFIPVSSGIGPVVAALKREGERRREQKDLRGAWAHFLAARDLAADGGLLDARKDAESRLAFLYGQDQAIGKPLSPMVAKNTYLSVSCVKHVDAALVPKPEEIPRDSPLNLFLPPGAGEVHLVVKLMDKKFKKPWAEVGFLYTVQRVPFSVELYWQPLEENGEKRRQARLRVEGLQSPPKKLNSDELSCPIPNLKPVPEPLELAVILDGTLPEAQLKQARHLATQVLQGLEARRVPGRASLIVFGDGPHGAKEYEPACYAYSLRPRPAIAQLIEKVQSLPVDDYQRNLEVGLQQARLHLAGSRVDRRVLLAIGNGEPHPPLKELQNRLDRDSGEYFRYLRDHLYDWHSELDWREEVNQLSDAGITLISVFMPTDAARAHNVWQELGRSGMFLEYQGSETAEHLIFWLEQQLKSDKQRYQLDGPLYLPAQSRLDSILPAEKQWSQYSNGPSPFGPS